MTEERKTVKTGWVFAANFTKAHYIKDGMSLCKRWMFLGKIYEDEQSDKQLKDDCKSCWRLLEKEQAKQNG